MWCIVNSVCTVEVVYTVDIVCTVDSGVYSQQWVCACDTIHILITAVGEGGNEQCCPKNNDEWCVLKHHVL